MLVPQTGFRLFTSRILKIRGRESDKAECHVVVNVTPLQ